MKTKILFFSLLIMAIGGSLFAQVPTPIVAGVVTADVGRNSNFKIIVNQNVTSVVLSSSTSPTGGQVVTLFFTENATGGFSVSFGGNISNPCTVNTAASATTNCQFQYDATSNTWFGAGGGNSSGSASAIFSISNTNCSLAANCLQWIDDDSTDNCGAATTAFFAVMNAYAGPGVPQLTIYGSSSGKAYKLAAPNCVLPLTNIHGFALHHWATIHCAQAAPSCVQVGPVNTPGVLLTFPSFQSYSIDGNGVFVDGTNLAVGSSGQTGAGGIYVEPMVLNFRINGVKFWGTGGAPGFGPTVATLGNNCNAWSIYIDYPVADGTVENVYDAVNATSSTVGGCGMANPNGSTTGSNTIDFINDTVGTAGFVGGTGNCGSIGILDGGSYGSQVHTLKYGFGMNSRLQGVGHRLIANEEDAANCSAKGVSAIYHVGANGSSAVIPQVLFSNNIVQVGSGHTTNFIGIAGDSTATMLDYQITGNITTSGGGGALMAGTPSCTPHLTSPGCYVAGNQNFTSMPAPTSAVPGWALGDSFIGIKSLTAQAANIGSTLALNATATRTYRVECQVISTNTPTGATLPALNLSYTDLNSGATATPACTSTASTSANGTVVSGFALVTITSGGAINFTTTGYAAGSGTALQYAVNIFVHTYGP
jgi:hypothetical protein